MSEPDGGGDDAPEVLLLLCDDRGYAGRGEHGVVLLDSEDALFLPVWSTLDRLVKLAGDGHPWMALHTSEVEDLRRQLDATVVLDAAWPTDLPP